MWSLGFRRIGLCFLSLVLGGRARAFAEAAPGEASLLKPSVQDRPAPPVARPTVEWILPSDSSFHKDQDPGLWPSSSIAKGPRLRVNGTSLLSSKQVSILEGGFTTVTQMVIQLPSIKSADDASDFPSGRDSIARGETPLQVVGCSVKFDAWAENFEVIRLVESKKEGPPPVLSPRTVNSREGLGELCLASELNLDGKAEQLALRGGILTVEMIVKQTSVDETAKVKEWLIEQQSGVVQGLFAHMLGDLTLEHVVRIDLWISPFEKASKSGATTHPVEDHKGNRQPKDLKGAPES